MLENMGFPIQWIGWVNKLLQSGSSVVLPNGVPGKFVKCKRGVRHGDLLAPLLFVLAA
jgi:hypothetical protein